MTHGTRTVVSETDKAAEELLATARVAVRRDSGVTVLDSLGWWDLLGSTDDSVLRFGLFSLFRAQGRELADTPALGALIVTPYVSASGIESGSAIAAVVHSSTRRGDVALVLGDPGGREILVDRPGHALAFYPADALTRPRALPGRLRVAEVDLNVPARRVELAENEVREARKQALVLGRIAAAAEMLGSAEGAMDLAVEHAGVREQFDQPIGAFQAVRHLLAWAETDTVALAAVVRQAVLGLNTLPAHYDEVAKAIAGRNARKACERSLQVLGGIGFTAEHAHHHHHSRVLFLDSLLGTSAELTHRLGARARETGTLPALTEHAITLNEPSS
jgi:hypothetical protein